MAAPAFNPNVVHMHLLGYAIYSNRVLSVPLMGPLCAPYVPLIVPLVCPLQCPLCAPYSAPYEKKGSAPYGAPYGKKGSAPYGAPYVCPLFLSIKTKPKNSGHA